MFFWKFCISIYFFAENPKNPRKCLDFAGLASQIMVFSRACWGSLQKSKNSIGKFELCWCRRSKSWYSPGFLLISLQYPKKT